ncbi:MAG: glutaminase A [Pseudomonadota bacterium]
MRDDVVQLDAHRQETVARQIFNTVKSPGAETISVSEFLEELERAGINRRDRRIARTVSHCARHGGGDRLDFPTFQKLLSRENTALLQRAFAGDLIVPDFDDFRRRITTIFDNCRDVKTGAVADYIPQLARIDPEAYAIGVCTVDGQQFSLGDDEETFCVQSTSKPISYAIALDGVGRRTVHAHVGREPSGRSFNELTLNNRGLPHNPMINAGAIMCASLIKPATPAADRFDYMMRVWESLCGGRAAGFDNSVYLSEKETADRNFALAYFMRENGAFPPDTDIIATLDFYFQCCSITVDVRQMAIVAATLANGGVCPTSDQRIFQSETVKDCLSLMYSCGMYDFSGEYAFTVGIPAKSGVSGALYLVIPGVCGIALWSPRLDALGNTVRGVEFSKQLVDVFAFHTYANMVDNQRLIDPRKAAVERDADEAARLCAAAARGDLGELRRLLASGVDLGRADYDGRTALHLAASEGQEKIVRFLIDQVSDVAPRDRWGATPLDDARREGCADIVALLEAAVDGGVDEIA